MNQDDVILLGQLLNDIDEVDDPKWVSYNKYKNLVQKAQLIAQQAKASKDYQDLMDVLNTQLSEIGKDDTDGKKKEK